MNNNKKKLTFFIKCDEDRKYLVPKADNIWKCFEEEIAKKNLQSSVDIVYGARRKKNQFQLSAVQLKGYVHTDSQMLSTIII